MGKVLLAPHTTLFYGGHELGEDGLQELEALSNDAPPGPWVSWGRAGGSVDVLGLPDGRAIATMAQPESRLCAAARTALPGLIAEVRHLRAGRTFGPHHSGPGHKSGYDTALRDIYGLAECTPELRAVLEQIQAHREKS